MAAKANKTVIGAFVVGALASLGFRPPPAAALEDTLFKVTSGIQSETQKT